jgi:hypothetical protein
MTITKNINSNKAGEVVGKMVHSYTVGRNVN